MVSEEAQNAIKSSPVMEKLDSEPTEGELKETWKLRSPVRMVF